MVPLRVWQGHSLSIDGDSSTRWGSSSMIGWGFGNPTCSDGYGYSHEGYDTQNQTSWTDYLGFNQGYGSYQY